jgi:hypothetical protein
MLSSTERQHKWVTSFTRPATLQPTLYFQAKINELRGALAEGRGDADAGTHSDGVSFGGEAERCISCSSSALTCGCFRFFSLFSTPASSSSYTTSLERKIERMEMQLQVCLPPTLACACTRANTQHTNQPHPVPSSCRRRQILQT